MFGAHLHRSGVATYAPPLNRQQEKLEGFVAASEPVGSACRMTTAARVAWLAAMLTSVRETSGMLCGRPLLLITMYKKMATLWDWVWHSGSHRVRRAAKPLPALEVVIELDFEQGSFVSPHPWQRATGRIPGQRNVVCRVGFGVSPLHDRLYVDGLIVVEAYRRQGYASALLKAVVDRVSLHGQALPVTALHEVWTSNAFWSALRDGLVPQLVVTQDVRVSEMVDEARRWKG